MNNDYEKIDEFTTQLRSIKGLYLFRIFSKYTSLRDINRLFNFLAVKEKEEDLRQLEDLWRCFISTGSIQKVFDESGNDLETD